MENRLDTDLYRTAWSLKACDGLPIEQIALRLERSPGEILELLLQQGSDDLSRSSLGALDASPHPAVPVRSR